MVGGRIGRKRRGPRRSLLTRHFTFKLLLLHELLMLINHGRMHAVHDWVDGMHSSSMRGRCLLLLKLRPAAQIWTGTRRRRAVVIPRELLLKLLLLMLHERHRGCWVYRRRRTERKPEIQIYYSVVFGGRAHVGTNLRGGKGARIKGIEP